MPAPDLHSWIRGKGRQPDSLVFDLDGTLWDSTETVANAWNAALRRSGRPEPLLTGADLMELMGLPHRDILHQLLPRSEGPQQEALLLACYAEEEQALHREGGRLYPGVAEGLRALAGSYPLCIVSNCPTGYIESFLAWAGLGELISDFECHGNTGLPKDENLILVAKRNGLENPVYVGDSLGDRHAAEKAGWPFIHARYGFGDAGEDCLALETFAELPEALLGRAQ